MVKNIKQIFDWLWRYKFVFLIVLLILGTYRWYECGFGYQNCYWRDWTGFGEYRDPKGKFTRGKTIWDLLTLIIVPLAIALTVWLLNRSQEKNKQQIETKRQEQIALVEADKQRQTALENYYDKMSELLLEENLRGPIKTPPQKDNSEEARKIARTRTLGLMQIMDADRKAQVLQFIYEADLINKENPIINLLGIDLSDSNLMNASLLDVKIVGSDFTNANLENAKLMNSNFAGSIFNKSILKNAKLTDVNFEQAVFTQIDFIKADFEKANVLAAIFDNVDLSSAQNFTQEMLDNVGSLKETKLPPGLTWKYSEV